MTWITATRATSQVGGGVNMDTAYGADPTGSSYSDAAWQVAGWQLHEYWPPSVAGQFHKFAYPLHCGQTMHIEGASPGPAGGTVMKFDAGVSGIVMDYVAGVADAAGSTVEHIQLLGQGGSSVARGLSWRREGVSIDVACNSFGGSGHRVDSRPDVAGTAQTGTFVNGNATVTLTAGAFTNNDRYGYLSQLLASAAMSFPVGTFIASITDATHAVMSQPANANAGVGQTFYTNSLWSSSGTHQSIADEGVMVRPTANSNAGSGVEFGSGDDTNAWQVFSPDVNGNTGWGVLDGSFLGNTISFGHSQSNTAGGYSCQGLNVTAASWYGLYSEADGGASVGPGNHFLMVFGGLFTNSLSGVQCAYNPTPTMDSVGFASALTLRAVATGAPPAGLGVNNDYCLRGDGTGTAHIYHKESGAWVPIA